MLYTEFSCLNCWTMDYSRASEYSGNTENHTSGMLTFLLPSIFLSPITVCGVYFMQLLLQVGNSFNFNDPDNCVFFL